jgi:hypothetical protein
MTRDNLQKRNLGKPTCCVFCHEEETISHLFFNCIVAKLVWDEVSAFFGLNIGRDYLSIAKFWVSNKKHQALNSICAATLWGIWKCRNALIFDSKTWISMKQVLFLIMNTLKKWRLLFKEAMLPQVDSFISLASSIIRAPLLLTAG